MLKTIRATFPYSDKENHRKTNAVPAADCQQCAAMPAKQIHLKTFIFATILVVSTISFSITYFITTSTYQQIFEAQAKNITRIISDQLIHSLLHLMKEGWSRQKLDKFVHSATSAQEAIPISVDVYRGRSVEQLFGHAGSARPDPVVAEAMRTGGTYAQESDSVIRQVYPVKAESSCLECHVNASAGETLGVLSLRQDISSTIMAIKIKFALLFLVLSPIPLLMAFFISKFIAGRIKTSTRLLHEKVKDVNRVEDLTTLALSNGNLGFVEFNRILAEIDILVTNLKEVAVDKDLLEFEINLLESFIITSETVRDWKEHVANLLTHVNEIMEAGALFALFKVDENLYELEIFWHMTPARQDCKKLEKIIKTRITGHGHFDNGLARLTVNHNFRDDTTAPAAFDEKEIDLQVKTLVLNRPHIGGVMAIGLQSVVSKDPGRALVIDSILTTLLNVVGSVRAIYRYTRELEYYATRDPLTGLYNQRIFWDLIRYEAVRSRRHNYKFAILVIDLDNFKMINDRFGHIFGDLFLKTFAGRVKECLRDGDIMTRYGGDEFAVILPESSEGQAYTAALRVMETIGHMCLEAPDGTRITATVSIGIAVYPDHSDEVNTLFTIADTMMYKSKREGKNRIGMPATEDIVEVLRTTEEKTLFLLNVLEEKVKIVPYFQPIMTIETGSVEIHELLMRIQHGDNILPASEFIGIAEHTGIISKLDYILIEKAFQEIKKKNYRGKLFINLSPKSLILKEFIANIRQLASEYVIDPDQIVFEITERETVRNKSLLEKFVRDLKVEGFNFAIDDFGSGFSSMQYIKMFPVDYIKIEGEFIKNTPHDSVDLAFVKSVITLAAELNIMCIAEHIETEEIFNLVKSMDGTYAQGFYISEPQPELPFTHCDAA